MKYLVIILLFGTCYAQSIEQQFIKTLEYCQSLDSYERKYKYLNNKLTIKKVPNRINVEDFYEYLVYGSTLDFRTIYIGRKKHAIQILIKNIEK